MPADGGGLAASAGGRQIAWRPRRCDAGRSDGADGLMLWGRIGERRVAREHAAGGGREWRGRTERVVVSEVRMNEYLKVRYVSTGESGTKVLARGSNSMSLYLAISDPQFQCTAGCFSALGAAAPYADQGSFFCCVSCLHPVLRSIPSFSATFLLEVC